MTDDAILMLARHPDTREEGFRQLILRYQQRLYQVVRRQVSTHEDADDILQNTFMKIFKHLDKFEERSELFTWMYRIATNEVINHHKKFRKMNVVEWGENDRREAESYINTDTLSQLLETLVAQLPGRQQTVFRMRYYDELSYKQMSEILNLTEGALKASFHHAVKKIEEELKAKQIV
jgi:RNA polymerase sigma-70 factor, ECF subfamily